MSSPSLSGHTAIVLTVSDRCFARTQEDRSGPAVRAVLEREGAAVLEVALVPDVVDEISGTLRRAAGRADLVVTTGGTGLAARDVTPEATLAVCERLVPGLPERMRAEGLRETPLAPLSRGVCGICGRALVLNLPGSPAGAEGSLRSVLHLLPHALGLLAGRTEHPASE